MSPGVILLAIELFSGGAFLRPHALLLQSPGFSGGKLEIKSVPDGANISVNGRRLEQKTDATFVVSPGNYRITVTGGPGSLNCGERSVSVYSGNVTTVTCTKDGWK